MKKDPDRATLILVSLHVCVVTGATYLWYGDLWLAWTTFLAVVVGDSCLFLCLRRARSAAIRQRWRAGDARERQLRRVVEQRTK